MKSLFKLKKEELKLTKDLEQLHKEYCNKKKAIEDRIDGIRTESKLTTKAINTDRIKSAKEIVKVWASLNNYKYIPKLAKKFEEYFVDGNEHITKVYSILEEYISCNYGLVPAWGNVLAEIGLTSKGRRVDFDCITDEQKDDVVYMLNLLQDIDNVKSILKLN